MNKMQVICLFLNLSLMPSHTFFTTRSFTTNPLYELANNNFEMNVIEKDKRGSWQFFLTPFYQKSTKGKNIGTFFMPNNKTCATFKEDGTGEIDSVWFGHIANIGLNYSSTICLAPERSSIGVAFLLAFDLDKICKNLWLRIN